jgi:hypothetical protein
MVPWIRSTLGIVALHGNQLTLCVRPSRNSPIQTTFPRRLFFLRLPCSPVMVWVATTLDLPSGIHIFLHGLIGPCPSVMPLAILENGTYQMICRVFDLGFGAARVTQASLVILRAGAFRTSALPARDRPRAWGGYLALKEVLGRKQNSLTGQMLIDWCESPMDPPVTTDF